MAMQVDWWERRDHADWDTFGRSALAHCRTVGAGEGQRSARFYSLEPDALALVEEVETLDIPAVRIAPHGSPRHSLHAGPPRSLCSPYAARS